MGLGWGTAGPLPSVTISGQMTAMIPGPGSRTRISPAQVSSDLWKSGHWTNNISLGSQSTQLLRIQLKMPGLLIKYFYGVGSFKATNKRDCWTVDCTVFVAGDIVVTTLFYSQIVMSSCPGLRSEFCILILDLTLKIILRTFMVTKIMPQSI